MKKIRRIRKIRRSRKIINKNRSLSLKDMIIPALAISTVLSFSWGYQQANRVKELEETQKQLIMQYHELEKTNDSQVDIIQSTQEKINEKDISIDNLKNIINSMQEEINEKTNEIASLNSEIVGLNDKVASYEEKTKEQTNTSNDSTSNAVAGSKSRRSTSSSSFGNAREDVTTNRPTKSNVYYTEGGKSYHSRKSCPTLKRSNVKYGTCDKTDPCNVCCK